MHNSIQPQLLIGSADLMGQPQLFQTADLLGQPSPTPLSSSSEFTALVTKTKSFCSSSINTSSDAFKAFDAKVKDYLSEENILARTGDCKSYFDGFRSGLDRSNLVHNDTMDKEKEFPLAFAHLGKKRRKSVWPSYGFWRVLNWFYY